MPGPLADRLRQRARPSKQPDTAPRGDRVGILRNGLDDLKAGRYAAVLDHVTPFAADDDLEASLLLGLAHGGLGQSEQAAPFLVRLAAQRPDALHPCLDLVGLLAKQSRARDAEPTFLACLRLAPEDANLLLAYGQLLYELLRPEDALAAVEQSLRIKPDLMPALNQRAIILVALDRVQEALALFHDIVADQPDNAPAWANLGCTLTAEGDFEEALSAYRQSIRIKPAEPQVRLNHSITLLKAGRMAQGWTEHEWRLKLPGHTALPYDRLMPSLARGADLTGQSILVTHEEGAGDTLMFLRYIPLLGRMGARVVVWVPPNLGRLCARIEGVAGVDVSDTVALETDWHCPFISLPRVFSGTPESWGVAAPYINTDPGRVAEAALHMPPPGRLRVGLVWGGAPRTDNLPAFAIDQRRSMPLRTLAPLAALRDVSLVSLQHGAYADQMNDPPDGLALLDPMGFVNEMDDTASLLRHIDVLVTVDTSMVHLAGGLGVPTILMDRYDNCWRWFYDREDSPWYPSVRIVRQTRPGDWAGVIGRVLPLLQEMADAKRARGAG